MRLVLMGTGPFAVPAFEGLRCDGYDIAAVLTKPIRDDKKSSIHPVAMWAMDHQLRIETPLDMRAADSIALVKGLDADLAVVCDYGQILNLQALESTRLGAINLHGSLLPKHRGAAPIQWSILVGDLITGVSVICMTTGLDSGPILTMNSTTINADENAQELESRLSQLGVRATRDAVELLRQCNSRNDVKALGKIQDNGQATKAPRLNKSDGQVDFRWTVSLIHRVVKAMQPWPSAFAEVAQANGRLLRVQFQRVDQFTFSHVLPSALSPGMMGTLGAIQSHCGEMLRLNVGDAEYLLSQDLVVVAQDGVIRIQRIQPSGKRVMTAKEFTAGYVRSDILQFILPSHTSLIV